MQNMVVHFTFTIQDMRKCSHLLVPTSSKTTNTFFSLPGPGDQLPVLLPERRGAVRHPGALGPLEAGARRGSGELLHSVILLGEQPRSRVFGQCYSDPQPVSGDAIQPPSSFSRAL